MSESVAETAAAAENEEQADDSMEKLAFDEEDEKNVSAEDLLGEDLHLMMSDDSENEEVSTEKPRKISPKARRQRMMDSDEEEKAGQEQREHISPKNKGQRLLDSDEEEEEEVVSKPKKKVSAILSSDSEEEQQVAKKKPAKKIQKKTSQEDQEQGNPVKKKGGTKSKKQTQEDNQEDAPSKKEKPKKVVRTKKAPAKPAADQVDKVEGSQMDQEDNPDQEKPIKTQKPKKLAKNKKEEYGSEEEKKPNPTQKPKAKKPVKNKKESLFESQEEDNQMDVDEDSKMDQEENQEQEKPAKKQKPKKLAKKKNEKMDSEEESQVDNNQNDLEQKKPSKKIQKNKLAKIDNEEDEEKSLEPKKKSKKNKQKIESDEESEKSQDEEVQDQDLKEMDSENDDEDVQKPSKKSKKKKQRMDSDSEDEIQKNQSEEETSSPKNKFKGLVDSESEQEESSAEISPAKNKLKGLVDSESEPELSNPEEPQGEQEATTEVAKEKAKKPKVVRESAKKALEGMQAIQSEQQRLHREAHINVPYHQPKPRTLKEFLSRRTINAPLATALAGGSPMPSRQPRKSVGLRMTREELEAYAKLMEERAKEATEFFKSESEPEEDNDSENEEPMELKDNPGVLDEVLDNPKTPEEPKDHIEELISKAIGKDPVLEQAIIEATIPEEEPMASTSAAAALKFPDNFEIQQETEPKSPSKVCLITEVVELPRLDLSTISITPPSKPATPKISEAIRRLKIEKSLDVSPSLKGDANMVIDLETGDMFAKKPTGVEDLLKRLMKTREAKKHKTTETVNILSTEHGKLEMSKVNIHLHEEEIMKEPKPGAGYIKMQEQLKSLITKKRMEELRKKQAEEQEKMAEDEEEEGMDVDEEYEPEDKPGYAEVTINEDEEIVERDEGTIEEEDEEEAEDIEADEKPEEEPLEDLEEEENSSESDEESEPETQAGKKKNRIIKAFEDDNSDDDLDLLQTPKATGVAPLTATQLQLSAHKLFDAETRRTASDEENELLDLCSGQFPQQSQMLSSAAPSLDPAVISQIPMTQFGGSSQAPDELEGLCSGTFATQLPTQAATQQPEQEESHEPSVVANRILSSDEELKEETTETDKPRNKKLTKKRPKKKAKLGFSDDEESDAEADEAEEFEEESDGEPVEEIPETFVDYDSEENEIVVEMTKKDKKMRAANFVDKEAELSESDWGSADEDEKNMDNYDVELGDEDQFDRDKLRHELGQIHARKMMDQDIREVRKIKEMLFEEEEEGASRQRQFRWKNVENGFSLDDHRPENGEGNEGSGDEDNEHLWRKIRYEREQLLLEKGLKPEAASPLSTSVINTSNSGNSIRRLNIISSKKTTVEVKKSSPFLISKTAAGKQKSAVRGSFLIRDQQTLTKLAAGLSKGTSAGDVDGTEGTISVKSTKAKNFVFATLTEEEHENRKRKAAEILNSSTETGVNFMKKPRLEPRREKCLIDQLL
ncbi:claspin [Drosophila takahashii]|uniref:claspin n=1 Tax=Drosophila takahashii TaxID=29030 RepID=UPI001CF85918|nr:claspin [Drosophila takahashii]